MNCALDPRRSTGFSGPAFAAPLPLVPDNRTVARGVGLDAIRLSKGKSVAPQSPSGEDAILATPPSSRAAVEKEPRRVFENAAEVDLYDLLAEGGTEIAEADFLALLARFPGDEKLLGLMIGRAVLPASVVARLAALVSGRGRERLLARHGLPPDLAAEARKQDPNRPRWWSRHMTTFFR